jgi:Ca-activated chloride channel homolog
VLDTSSSMRADLPLVQQAAKGLLSALRDGDRAAVLSVNSVVGMPQRFTTDRAEAAAAIDALRAAGVTALYDGVYIALKEFAREQRDHTDVRRQVLVLLSDGVDTASHISADDLTELAKRVGVNVYVIAIKRPTRVPFIVSRDAEQRGAFTMRTLAQNAGGRIFLPTMAGELPAMYRAIALELASQYDLGYVPAKSGGDDKFRRVAVRVLPPTSAVARTRSGYYSSRSIGTRSYVSNR